MVAEALINATSRKDAKSVAIIALACLHPVTKVQNAALHFFLNEESEDEPDEETTGVPNANSDSDSEPEIGPEDGENEEFVMGDAYDSIL